jgi:hypothetical protein
MEIISETKNPKEFTKSSSLAFGTMCFFYSFAVGEYYTYDTTAYLFVVVAAYIRTLIVISLPFSSLHFFFLFL